MCILSSVYRSSAKRIVGIMLIQPVKFIQNRSPWYLQRRNTAKQVPETFKMVFHLSAAPHDISSGCIKDTVTGSSGNIHGFQNMNLFSRHLAIPYQKAGCSQSCKTASHNICAFLFYAFRLFRSCKSFVIPPGIINPFCISYLFSPFCITICLITGMLLNFFFLILDFFLFINRRSCSCCKGCNSDSNIFFLHSMGLLSVISALILCLLYVVFHLQSDWFDKKFIIYRNLIKNLQWNCRYFRGV